MEIYDMAKCIFSELEDEVNETTKWKSTSAYIEIRHLQIDKRGSFGERLLRDVFARERNINVVYADGDQGDWDLQINGVKVEVKTSSLDVNGKFQNEHIKQNGDYDVICFVGVAPDEIYVKFIKQSEIDFGVLHNRGERNTGAGYKWDLKPAQMNLVSNREEVVKLFNELVGLDKSKIKKTIKGV